MAKDLKEVVLTVLELFDIHLEKVLPIKNSETLIDDLVKIKENFLKIHSSNGNLEIIEMSLKEVFVTLEKLLKNQKHVDIPLPPWEIIDALFALVKRDFESDKIDPLLHVVL